MHMLWYVAIAFIGYVRCYQEPISNDSLREFIGKLEAFGHMFKFEGISNRILLTSYLSQNLGDRNSWSMDRVFEEYKIAVNTNNPVDEFTAAVEAYLRNVRAAQADQKMSNAVTTFNAQLNERNRMLEKLLKNVYLLGNVYDEEGRMNDVTIFLNNEVGRYTAQIGLISRFYKDTEDYQEQEGLGDQGIERNNIQLTSMNNMHTSIVRRSFAGFSARNSYTLWLAMKDIFSETIYVLLHWIHDIKDRYSNVPDYIDLLPRIENIERLIATHEETINKAHLYSIWNPPKTWGIMQATTSDVLFSTIREIKDIIHTAIVELIPQAPDAEKDALLMKPADNLDVSIDRHKVNMLEVLQADVITQEMLSALGATATALSDRIEDYSNGFHELMRNNTDNMSVDQLKPLVLNAMSLDARVKEQIMITIKRYMNTRTIEFQIDGVFAESAAIFQISRDFDKIMKRFDYLKNLLMSQTANDLKLNLADIIKLMGEQVDMGLLELTLFNGKLKEHYGGQLAEAEAVNPLFSAVSHLKNFYGVTTGRVPLADSASQNGASTDPVPLEDSARQNGASTDPVPLAASTRPHVVSSDPVPLAASTRPHGMSTGRVPLAATKRPNGVMNAPGNGNSKDTLKKDTKKNEEEEVKMLNASGPTATLYGFALIMTAVLLM
ncbi:hypothetical protein BgAZ_305300 [Babesia gibsoni]|uniref:Uncharacterized protein n=1 Tax=Babesia gibsoni TaxID=33632 RepID=A0AAD8PE17_BABGI|nr:hypothetical protein BgAZ_305300 [Babesia gibsoni]